MEISTLFLFMFLFLTFSETHAFHDRKNHSKSEGGGYVRKRVINAEPGSVPTQQPVLALTSNKFPSAKLDRHPMIDDILQLSKESGMPSTEKTARDEDDSDGLLSMESNTTYIPYGDNETSSSSPIPNNSTEIPINSSSPTPTITSTTEITTTEITTPPTTEIPFIPGEHGESTKSFFCLCDLRSSCDMNCCCDPDCSDEEKELFTGCEGSVIYDPTSKRNKDRSCYKSFVMYTENSPNRIDRTEKGMFCIVKDNMRQEREFSQSDMDMITKKILKGRISLKQKYSWDEDAAVKPSYLKMKNEPYRYGSVIWTTKTDNDDQQQILRLPTSYHSNLCSLKEPIKYLQDSNFTCLLPISNLKVQCAALNELNVNHFIRNYTVISNPKMLKDDNATDIPICHINTNDQCFSDNDFVEGDSEDEVENTKPQLDLGNSICHKVLSQLKLMFIHEGINGITKVVAKSVLEDIPLDTKELKQEFSVEFIWANDVGVGNETNATSSTTTFHKQPRSGIPGYIVGKPVILGKKMEARKNQANDSKEYEVVQRIQVLPDASQWLHVQSAGNCPVDYEEITEFARNPILFGYEHSSTCRLVLDEFRHCEQLQQHIASFVFGAENPIQFTKAPLYVSAYGSPDAFPSDWVPLSFIDISGFLGSSPSSSSLLANGCDGVITGVHVTIAYALVGPVDAPQAKITGVFYEPEESFQLTPEDDSQCKSEVCTRKSRYLSVTTTVSFVDVSKKPTSRVATWPVVSIRLPEDFFYPFSSAPSPSGATMPRTDISKSFVYFNMYFILAPAMPRVLPSTCRIPKPVGRAPPPTPTLMRTSLQQRDESSPLGSGRTSRIATKPNNPSNPYKYNESAFQDRYSTHRRRTSAVNYSNSHSNVPPPPEQYTPPQNLQKSRYYGSFRNSITSQNQQIFEKDFGVFGTSIMQHEQQQQQQTQQQAKDNRNLNKIEDINAMFKRPDYNPPPCGNCTGGDCLRAASPIQNGGGGQYNNRSSMAQADIYGSYVSTQQRTSWDQQAISAIPGHLPPTTQPIISGNGGETASANNNATRRSLKSDELDRILAKYGKSSRSSIQNNSNNNNEQDPDFACIRVDSFQQVTEKFCEPPVNLNPAIQPMFWNNNRKTEEQLPQVNLSRTERRRNSAALEKSMESLMKQMNTNNNNNNNSDSGIGIISNSSVPAFKANKGEHEQKNQLEKRLERTSHAAIPEYKRSTHVFPFKETASGHLVVTPEQIAFESRKISVLVADPSSGTVGLEFSAITGGGGGNSLHTSTSKNERILHEVKKAMSIAEAVDRKNSSSKIQPREKLYQKKYSESTSTSEEFQKSILERIVTAKNPDTHVMIGDKTYPCHSLALEAFSSHFDRLRPELFVQQIHLPETEVASSVFPIIMDWIVQSEEGRKEILTKENLIQVYAAAKYLGIRQLESQCISFLERKVEASDPDLLTMWDEVKKRQGSFPELVRIIASKLASSYHEIYAARRFLHMDVDELYMLLSSNDISIDSEMDVYDSAVSWLLHDWKNRKTHTNRIMSTIRFGLLTPLQLTQINLCPEISKMKTEKDYSQIFTYGTVKEMIDDGLAYSIFEESYKSQPEELKKWVQKTAMKAPAPRTCLVNKKRGTPYIMEKISLLEDASQTKLKASFNKIPERSSSYTIVNDEHHLPRPGTPTIDSASGVRAHNLGIPGGSTDKSKSRIPTIVPSTSSAQAGAASTKSDKGTSKRFNEGSGNSASPAFHEISKPKLLTNHSSNVLMKTNSDEETGGMDPGLPPLPLSETPDGNNK
ncbi:Tectonic-1 [Orchesella cincta]|uniref:Tectonic-1 n=1 Tax=Orchesella cincta TaxID=48709 RepID=A0A1D2NCI5_ORCCI|nr:Tectonic-1 [Orchesella cincta]